MSLEAVTQPNITWQYGVPSRTKKTPYLSGSSVRQTPAIVQASSSASSRSLPEVTKKVSKLSSGIAKPAQVPVQIETYRWLTTSVDLRALLSDPFGLEKLLAFCGSDSKLTHHIDAAILEYRKSELADNQDTRKEAKIRCCIQLLKFQARLEARNVNKLSTSINAASSGHAFKTSELLNCLPNA